MVIYPHKTTCYDELEKVVTKDIPMCTLKNFPYLIEHCIEFSKIYFSELFEKNIDDLNSCIKNPDIFFKKLEKTYTEKNDIIERLDELGKLLNSYNNKNIINLMEYSLEKYYIFFNKNIVDLITKIPSYSLDEKGEPFWRGSKIMPHPINFNVKDDLSIKFIFYLIKIINRILRINLNIKQDEIINRSYNIYEKIISKEYNLLTEKEQIDTIEKNKLKIKELIKESKLKDMNFNPEKFEKDNDDLFHVDFTFCFSNLRARNYNIEECDKEKVRKIAGNIIPAIVSTTACIAGFVALQIYSVIVSNDINLMRNIGLDLGNSWNSIGRPEEVKIYESTSRINNNYNLIDIPFTFSIWDSISIKGNLIAKDFIDIFKKEYNIDIDYINANNECLLDMIENENNEDINKTIEELFLNCFKIKSIDKNYLKLIVLGTKNNTNVKIPIIKYILK